MLHRLTGECCTVGTIQKRTRRDGSIAYTATVRVKRGGRVILSLSETFAREPAARAWVEKKEAEAKKPGGLARLSRPRSTGKTLGEAIDRYLETSIKEIGRTKAQVLRSIKSDEIADYDCAEVTSEALVAFAQRLGNGRQPQTVMSYLSHLQAIFAVARPAWGMALDPNAITQAMNVSKRLGLISKSVQRSRRPTKDEMNRLMEHFLDRHIRARALPMHKVCAFALFSTRRQEEITRILWADLEPGRVLVRDMKHPGEKDGNHVWVDLPPEAEAIARAMPKTDPEIFPFSTDAITANFTRACKILDIHDLRFHDLRHEGVSRLFEMGRTIPQAACVSGHRSWQSLQRYAHLRAAGDKWQGWEWIERAQEPSGPIRRPPLTRPASRGAS